MTTEIQKILQLKKGDSLELKGWGKRYKSEPRNLLAYYARKNKKQFRIVNVGNNKWLIICKK